MAASKTHGLHLYILRRMALMIPTFIGVTFVVFLLCQFVPGGPIDQLRMQMAGAAGGQGEAGSGASKTAVAHVSDKELEALKKYYGFDKPVPVQYFLYMKNVFTLELGDSFKYSQKVTGVIFQRLPVSVYYGFVTMVLTYIICIPLGMLKAVRHKSWLDNTSSVLIFLGFAVPGFALGAVLLAVFAVHLQWFPLAGFRSQNFEELTALAKIKDIVHHSVLPLICYMVGSFAVMTMLMKNSLIENMSADYVKTALANGLSSRRAIFVHALRNSLIPLATSFGGNIGFILTGSLLIERVFQIQGMGLLFFESILARDYPVVMGITVISALLLLLGNLLSDLCVAAVDPRVRFQ